MADTTAAPTKADIWRLTHEHRQRVADLLATLTPEEWDTPSLCAGWRVRDVAAHNVETHLMTPGRFFTQFAGSGFRFTAFNARGVFRHSTEPTSDLLQQFRATAARSSAPPGPALTVLGETVIHGEDMARPLAKHIDTSPDALVAVAGYAVRTTPLLHGKQRSAGLQLRATDVAWAHGEGPEVSGPAAALIMAICGRAHALGDLSGPGVDTLRSRM